MPTFHTQRKLSAVACDGGLLHMPEARFDSLNPQSNFRAQCANVAARRALERNRNRDKLERVLEPSSPPTFRTRHITEAWVQATNLFSSPLYRTRSTGLEGSVG